MEDDAIRGTHETPSGGGCLIATAAYGSELAPQVQLLREIRDNMLLSTDSGISFMAGFNQLYYSFSPAVADLERENAAFKDAVRVAITPALYTLSIMTLADQNSDASVIAFGLLTIAAMAGIYMVGSRLGCTRHRQKSQTRIASHSVGSTDVCYAIVTYPSLTRQTSSGETIYRRHPRPGQTAVVLREFGSSVWKCRVEAF